jgi:hypothetical protein
MLNFMQIHLFFDNFDSLDNLPGSDTVLSYPSGGDQCFRQSSKGTEERSLSMKARLPTPYINALKHPENQTGIWQSN